jgi:hypothetical protein
VETENGSSTTAGKYFAKIIVIVPSAFNFFGREVTR